MKPVPIAEANRIFQVLDFSIISVRFQETKSQKNEFESCFFCCNIFCYCSFKLLQMPTSIENESKQQENLINDQSYESKEKKMSRKSLTVSYRKACIIIQA